MSIGHSGTTADGRQVDAVTIGSKDLTVTILTYGAILQKVMLTGVPYSLTLGSPVIEPYEGKFNSFGSFMGPVINRIKGAKATIAGQEFAFEKHHSGDLTQHSGSTGMQRQVWDVADHGDDFVTLRLSLPDGLGGFPGNRDIHATYRVSGNALTLTAQATSDAPTLMNPANHSYWNMDGTAGFAGHILNVHADRFTEPNDALMPTGKLLPVDGSPYDFRDGMTLSGDDSQFFDLNLVLSDTRVDLRPVAKLTGTSGVWMEMSTTECGLQVYDCGTISRPDFPTNHDRPYTFYEGVALEAQSWPGATVHDHFPSIVLNPGDTYEQVTQWAFGQA